MKAKLDLTVGEINRLCRYIDKNLDGTIDYYKFLESLNKISKDLKEGQNFKDLPDFTEQMKNFLNNNKLSPALFVRKAFSFSRKNSDDLKTEVSTSKVSCEALASYIHRTVFPNCFYNEVCFYTEKADIDQDGFIDADDFGIFLQRSKYFHTKRPFTALPLNSPSQKITGFYNGEDGTQSLRMWKTIEINPNLFPKEPLDESKADIVIRDLRQALFFKKISFFEFFKILDSNKDGFITIEEFCSGMDKVIKFSQPIKEGFFSYMDKQKIGMIDYKAFLFTMNKSIFTKQAVKEN